MSFPPRTPAHGQWTSALCDCADDCGTCCEGFFCPCCLASSQYNMITRGIPKPDDLCTCILVAFACYPMSAVTTCQNRAELRRRYGITDHPSSGAPGGEGECKGCFISCCCLPCALAQQHKEMTYRGQFPGGLFAEMPPFAMAMPMGTPAPYAVPPQQQQQHRPPCEPYGSPHKQSQHVEMYHQPQYNHQQQQMSPPQNFGVPAGHHQQQYRY